MKKLILIFLGGILFLFSSESSFAVNMYKGYDLIGSIPNATQDQKDKILSLFKSGMTWGDIVATDNTLSEEQKKQTLGNALKAKGDNYEGKELDDIYDKFKKECENDVKEKAAKKAKEEKNKADWAYLREVSKNTDKMEKDKEKENGTFVPADTTVQAPAKTQASNSNTSSAASKKNDKVDAVGIATSGKTPASDTKQSAGQTSTSSSSSSSKSKCNLQGLFGTLLCSASEIFVGMRTIIFAVSGFGIMAVAIGGFFGQLNWKWLGSIIIGLFVISTTSALINYMVDSDAIKPTMITDTLIAAK